MEYVGLTNLFKFVSVNRTTRAGNKNRNWINKQLKIGLLKDEIAVLHPKHYCSSG